jgi:hypothetical protein
MPDYDASAGPYQPYPFVPSVFYAVPLQWLSDVRETGDLDTRHLLLAMHSGVDAQIVFPPDRGESTWTRVNADGLPNIVSYPTYLQYLKALLARGWLQPIDAPQSTGRAYVLPGWPHFDGRGRIYVPRNFIYRRWPVWLGQGQWAPRAALMLLFAQMALQTPRNRQPANLPAEATAYLKELKGQAANILPAAQVANKVGDGLRSLVDLGLVTVIEQSHTNRRYQLRSDAFDQAPDWPQAEVADRCGLDLTQDQPWASLVQAFLRHNLWPLGRSAEVWAAIRRYAPDAVTHEDARAIQRLLERRLKRPRVSRSALSPQTILKDYIAQQRRPWVTGPEFTLDLIPNATSQLDHWLPVASPINVDATQLLIYPQPGPRLKAADACALLQGTRWYVRQPLAPHVAQLIELTAPLRPDRHTLTEGLLLDGNYLHRHLRYDLPFTVTLETAAASPRLTLQCRFRVLLGRTAAAHLRIAEGAESILDMEGAQE